VKLLGGTGLLGAFVAGIALKPFLKNEAEKSVEHFEAVTERLVTPLFIVLIGILLPFGQWQEIGPVLLAAVGGILLLRRLPAFLLLSPAIPALRDVDERVFVGWFGPIGVSAASYAALASGHVGDPLLWPVTSAVVTGSIVVHGLSATPLGRRLGRHEERARTRERDARGAA
jgi:NhaP-type Na+/H+ or K+/H+ antiporter